VALGEAPDVLHRAIHTSLYCLIRMATEIGSNSHAFFDIVNCLFEDNRS